MSLRASRALPVAVVRRNELRPLFPAAKPAVPTPPPARWLVTGLVAAGLVAGLLIAALSDRSRLRAMGLEGRRKAIEYFNWDRVARIMLDVMDRTT